MNTIEVHIAAGINDVFSRDCAARHLGAPSPVIDDLSQASKIASTQIKNCRSFQNVNGPSIKGSHDN